MSIVLTLVNRCRYFILFLFDLGEIVVDTWKIIFDLNFNVQLIDLKQRCVISYLSIQNGISYSFVFI